MCVSLCQVVATGYCIPSLRDLVSEYVCVVCVVCGMVLDDRCIITFQNMGCTRSR